MTNSLTYSMVSATNIDTIPLLDKTKFPSTFRNKSDSSNHYFLCAASESEVVGIAKLYIPPNSFSISLDFIEVAEDTKSRGVARSLLDYLCTTAAAEGKAVGTEGFTASGRHLLRIMDEFNQKAEKPVFFCGSSS